MAEANCKEINAEEGQNSASFREVNLNGEIISPYEELVYADSHRMRRVRWSEDLEEIRYFNAKSKKEKRRVSFQSCNEKDNSSPNHRRRFSDLPIPSFDKFKTWIDDKDFKSDVMLLGLRLKSAFKKADFYNAEGKWDDVFEQDSKNVSLNGIEYKR